MFADEQYFNDVSREARKLMVSSLLKEEGSGLNNVAMKDAFATAKAGEAILVRSATGGRLGWLERIAIIESSWHLSF